MKDLQEGRPRAMGEVARQLDADVLVQLQARPTRQTPRGLEIRVVGEAINVGRGGQSIGRAVVEVPPPLDKPQLNKYTRFLARKLMDGMTASWRAMGPGQGRAGRTGASRRDRRPRDPATAAPRIPRRPRGAARRARADRTDDRAARRRPADDP